MKNFDWIAPIYDQAARAVFGRSMIDSQTTFFDRILDHGEILIVGGGTGWVLPELFSRKPGCRVVYIDSSPAMIRKAQQQSLQGHCEFKCALAHQLPDRSFDAIVTNFFLDVLNDPSLIEWVRRAGKQLRPGGIWIVTEFEQTKSAWHHALLAIMYTFFRWTCGIEATALPDWKGAFATNRIALSEERHHYSSFIRSCLYRPIDSVSNGDH